jgi:hypothetical protein
MLRIFMSGAADRRHPYQREHGTDVMTYIQSATTALAFALAFAPAFAFAHVGEFSIHWVAGKTFSDK